jgi:uncharacterized protein
MLLAVMMIAGCSGDKKNTNAQHDKIIIDDAGILSAHPEIIEQYRSYNEKFLENFDIDFRVITTSSAENINSFSNAAFAPFQQESRSKSGKALLLVINTRLDETRLEVSMALEPIYTDAFVSYIERKGMVPYFRDMRLEEGVYMMTELVRDRAVEAKQGNEFMPPMESRSLGGGARNEAKIGQVDQTTKQGEDIFAEATDTPEDILAKHLAGLKSHNKNPNLDIFSEATRIFFKKLTVTDINMSNEYRFVSQCQDGNVIYADDDMHAVLLHPIEQRTCVPYLFVKEQGKWRLDIATMAKVIRFNTEMNWHFSLKDREIHGIPYEFVFGGFNYDQNGFPFNSYDKPRWGFRCSDYSLPGEQPEKILCLVSWLAENGAAKNVLGLQLNDIISGVGDGKYHTENPDIDGVMSYFSEIPSGERATVIVDRKKGGRQQLQAEAPRDW